MDWLWGALWGWHGIAQLGLTTPSSPHWSLYPKQPGWTIATPTGVPALNGSGTLGNVAVAIPDTDTPGTQDEWYTLRWIDLLCQMCKIYS